ncbi:SDR family oxidoreductase [Patulibacter sp.]|uniref:SDR family oxidoreductase n=1 Tax=Patulibacter sp. TaxID=1912859 RepID=UPI00272830A7|nr:SDR family NAD(P)-dependent oxidoreductase [Patulibacter sp.]MDO9408538.1 SDR family NAD(P)-dependent oxidoreductase [Patulibacter sp.]
MSRLDLRGRGVLLSGATGGIGSVVARQLLDRGAKVALVSRPSERLDDLVAELDSEDAVAFPADVTDRGQVVEATDAAAERFGGLVAAIAGAGVVLTGTIAEQDEKDVRTVIDTNLYGTLWTLQAALPHVDAADGHLLAVASIAGIVPTPLAGIYPATKAAVGEVVAQLRMELMHRRTSAGVLYLGMVDTEMSTMVGEDDRLRRTFERTPGALTGSLTAEDAASRVVRAIEHRQGAVVAPAWQLPLAVPQLGLQKVVETGMRFSALARELPGRRAPLTDRRQDRDPAG